MNRTAVVRVGIY